MRIVKSAAANRPPLAVLICSRGGEIKLVLESLVANRGASLPAGARREVIRV